MERAWSWAVAGSGFVLAASLLWFIYQHTRFAETMLLVLLTEWG